MVMMKKTVHLQRTEKSSRAQSQNDFTRCCLLLSRCKLAADKRDGSPRHSQFSLGHYIHTFPGWGGGWGDVGGWDATIRESAISLCFAVACLELFKLVVLPFTH